MLTRCPACETAFRITAEQLAAAHGRVRCGRCRKVFNALECIADEDPPPLAGTVAGGDAREAQTGVAAGLDDPVLDTPAPAVAGMDGGGTEARQQVPGDEAAVPASDDSLDVLLEEMPPALRDELAQDPAGPGYLARVLWAVAALLLVLLLLAQLAWTFQDRLLAAIPALGTYRDAVCGLLDCQARSARPPGQAIRMLARDVRKHPRYRDTLLVNGTLVNGSEQPVPFPLLQFGLYNVDGVLIGARRFKPVEYLDQSIDIGQGMLPGQPVHIVLEITGVSDAAVSFEFDFL